jgi:AraC-like DNA-binding protein
MLKELLQTLYILTVVQLILLAVFLFNYKKRKIIGNKILSAFLISNALFIVYFILFGAEGYLKKYTVDFFHIGFPFRFLFGPLIFLYIKSIAYVDFKLKKRTIIHFIPFILEYVFLFFALYIHNHDAKLEILRSKESLFHILNTIIFWLFNVHVLGYMFICLKIIRNGVAPPTQDSTQAGENNRNGGKVCFFCPPFQGINKKSHRKLPQDYSNIDHLKLNWLRIILWSFIFMWQIDLASFVIYKIFAIVNHSTAFALFSVGINYIGAILLVYFGLKHPNIFSCVEGNDEKMKYEKSALTADLKEGYLKKLLNYIDKEKPYLNFCITLGEISKNLAVPQNYLSQVINELLDQNFYDFINSYRIREAKRILANPKYIEKPVLEILTDVGFNSKSSFYTAFTKETGMTPVTFRKKHNGK